ncbi:hypothetical protein BCBD1442_24630 [Brucella ceti]|nr:hypothetical protein BCBD1442_24630 [Brucella ceti]
MTITPCTEKARHNKRAGFSVISENCDRYCISCRLYVFGDSHAECMDFAVVFVKLALKLEITNIVDR